MTYWQARLPLPDVFYPVLLQAASPLCGLASICDCDPLQYHRWNCAATPIWAQTMGDLDINPWTVCRPAMWVFEDIAPHIKVTRP
jgi:hypothetical protein